MQTGTRRIFSRLTVCSLLTASISTYLQGIAAYSDQTQDAGAPKRTVLQGQAATFGVLTDETQSRYGLRCTTLDSEHTVIVEVKPGTPAASCNLTKGDRILDAQAVGSALEITIERDNKFFKARLRAIAKDTLLVAQKPMMDNTVRKPFTLNAEQTVAQDNQLIPESATLAKQNPRIAAIDSKRFSLQADKNAKLLSEYNLELIVDRSKSMKQTDCPGGLSRWEWCGLQAGQLSKSLAPYTPSGLTIIPFASEYDIYEHASPQNIETIFSTVNLQFGTRLFEPLTERMDEYFAHRKPNSKPLLVVIITDGEPFPKFEPALVKKSLIDESQKMKSQEEALVIFCQIGTQDRSGQRYLGDLEQNLQSDGARYRYVHVISFDDLQNLGLGPALAAQIQQCAPSKTAAMVTSSRPAPGQSNHVSSVIARAQTVAHNIRPGVQR